MKTLRNTASALACASPVLQAGSAVVDVGSTFSIDVSVSGAVDVQSFQFDLAYESTRLRLLGFGRGGLPAIFSLTELSEPGSASLTPPARRGRLYANSMLSSN